MLGFGRKRAAFASALFFLLSVNQAFAEYAFNFHESVSPLTRYIFDVHMLTTRLAFWIMVVIIAIVGFAIFRFRKSVGYEADQDFHKSTFGVWSWILVPVIVLGIDFSISGPGLKALDMVEKNIDADLTVKVIGSQWKWTYEYVGSDVEIISNLLPQEKAGDKYLREVDNPLILPTHKKIRFLHTASDVLHAWWVPAITVKKDSIPGYINETWTEIDKEGDYYGQCAENCGRGHAYMPIHVRAVSPEAFDKWLDGEKQKEVAALAEAQSDKEWAKEELIEKGERVFNTYCAACHQTSGLGVPGVFPALKGSAIATGPVEGHINIVMKGKAGTAMASWAAQLSDLDMAAVISYERNAWGNNKGDFVQPKDIKAAR
ncbi:MAG TPA: cytochrome c oxidase subunit II [Pseudomonadales bacterium]|nr:cytochrome c oxidase subunit II [Pseudomonadales bacterium]